MGAIPGGITIEGVQFVGGAVGKLDGSLLLRSGELSGHLHGEDIDLGKVTQLVGAGGRIGGLANVDLDLASSFPR